MWSCQTKLHEQNVFLRQTRIFVLKYHAEHTHNAHGEDFMAVCDSNLRFSVGKVVNFTNIGRPVKLWRYKLEQKESRACLVKRSSVSVINCLYPKMLSSLERKKGASEYLRMHILQVDAKKIHTSS